MITGQFSHTAFIAAGIRAAHQVADNGAVLFDPLIVRLLGQDLTSHLVQNVDPVMRPLRLFVALRSRIAEDVAQQAVAEGARQIVVLGAGFDTFGWRITPIDGLTVFEVDQPAMQQEKQRRLAAAGIETPPVLRFVPIDLESQPLGDVLESAGFDPTRRSSFLWLGATPYLRTETVQGVFHSIAGLAGGAELVFDYANPPDSIDDPGHRLFHERVAARVAELGEAFRTYFSTPILHHSLRSMGFEVVSDLGPRGIAERFTPGAPMPPENGGHILHASVRGL